ncbi:MAG: VWA domain-containing protein [Pseudomonadota bacterium]
MSVIFPIALVLLLPLAALAWAMTRSDVVGAGRLPGAWERLISPPLRSYIADRAAIVKSAAPTLCLAIAALIAVALARPGLITETKPDYANIVGRVVVIDVAAGLPPQTVYVNALLEASPHIPTALIASAGESYLIAPFTTDPKQITRYLNAIRPEMMPLAGRRPHLGLALAERTLDEAGLLVRQIIVTSAGDPPPIVGVAASDTLRHVVGAGGAGWRDYADAYQADLGDADPAPTITAIEEAARAAVEASLPGARTELTPWLIGGTLLLLLPLFRRRSA